MAKLSAHGSEVARLSIGTDLAADRTISREELHYSFRSDGHIMQRHVVVFRSDGRRHDYGWKRYKRLSEPKRDTVTRQINLAQRWAEKADNDGVLMNLNIGPLYRQELSA